MLSGPRRIYYSGTAVLISSYLWRRSSVLGRDEVGGPLGGAEGDVGDGHGEGEERQERGEEGHRRPLAGTATGHEVLEAHGDRYDAEENLLLLCCYYD